MNRPSIKQFSKSFTLDNSLVTVDRKQYAKELEIYVDHLETYIQYVNNTITKAKAMPLTFDEYEKSLNHLG